MQNMKAFHVDDETMYAAIDAEQAAVLYEKDTGAACEGPDYPRELLDAELAAVVPVREEDECLTGADTTLRDILAVATEPGMIACNV